MRKKTITVANLHVLLCVGHLLLGDLLARLPLHVHHLVEERLVVLLLLGNCHRLDNFLVFSQTSLLLDLAVPLLVQQVLLKAGLGLTESFQFRPSVAVWFVQTKLKGADGVVSR